VQRIPKFLNKTVTELISGNYFSCTKNTNILEQNGTDLINANDFSYVKRVPQPDATKPLRLKRTGKHSTNYNLWQAKEKQIINGNGKLDTRFQVLTVQ
jgi:hypothetical protein